MSQLRTLIGSVAFASLVGCAPPSAAPVAAAAPVIPPAVQSTKVMILRHGLGFICWLRPLSVEVWCWPSEQAALNDGNAGRIGLTSLAPKLIYSDPTSATTNLLLFDHGVCAGGNCLGDILSGTTSTYEETLTCDITSPESVHCAGPANPDLTFPGESFSFLGPDVKVRHYPHSRQYYAVRRTA